MKVSLKLSVSPHLVQQAMACGDPTTSGKKTRRHKRGDTTHHRCMECVHTPGSWLANRPEQSIALIAKELARY